MTKEAQTQIAEKELEAYKEQKVMGRPHYTGYPET